MSFSTYTSDDFAISPLMFYYEVTRACDLVCKHCRASAQECSHPEELTMEQSKALIDQISTFPRKPNLVLTGGDPLKRADIFDLIRHAVGAGLQVALTPSATPLATWEMLCKAKEAVSNVWGSAWMVRTRRRTMRMMIDARQLGLSVQINTTITRRNFGQIDHLASLLSTQAIAMWSVFFLFPVGRGIDEERISPEQYEEAFERLWIQAGRQPYGFKTTEAPHYQRFVLQRHGAPLAAPSAGQTSNLPKRSSADRGGENQRDSQHGSRNRGHRAPLGVRDGNGIMFVGNPFAVTSGNSVGVCTSGVLPLTPIGTRIR